jgi:hypothetical protein
MHIDNLIKGALIDKTLDNTGVTQYFLGRRLSNGSFPTRITL